MKPERRFWQPDVAKDVDDELAHHLEMREQELAARGVDPSDARDLARRRFGDVTAIAAACRNIDNQWYREQRRASMWMDLRQDVVYGLRVLRKSPAFLVAAVASLSLGIAATTAVFSMINALLLRSLPGVADSSRLASIMTLGEWLGGNSSSEESHRYYRQTLTAFSDIAGFSRLSVAVGVGEQPFVAGAQLVTPTYFAVLGTQPAAGRLIDASVYDAPVAVVSHELAVQHFGGSDRAAGRPLLVNGQELQIVGVAPPAFLGVMTGGLAPDAASRPHLWIPLPMRNALRAGSPRSAGGQASSAVWLHLVGRLAPKTTFGAARAQAAAVPPHTVIVDAAALFRPSTSEVKTASNTAVQARARVVPLGWGARDTGAEIALAITLLLGVPLIVLAIGCANTANLQLARASHRLGEIAVRRSLGATRSRVVRQLLIESILVATVAGVIGIALTVVVVRLFSGFVPVPMPIDWRVLLFAMGIASVTGIGFGLAPALGVTRGDLVPALKDAGGTPTFRRSRLRNGLVLAQIALSLLLLVMAGLFTRTLQRLEGVDDDRQMSQVAAASVDLAALLKYTPEESRAFQEELLARVQGAPGVVAAAVAPFEPYESNEITFRRPERTYSNDRPFEFTHGVAALGRFIETAGLRVVRGRGFTDAERTGTPRVAVVTETLARRIAPDRDVLGVRLLVGDYRIPTTEVTIVGVLADMSLRPTVREMDALLLPSPLTYGTQVALWIRTTGDPTMVLPHVRNVIRELDPRLPFRIGPAESWLTRELREVRWLATALAAMGGLALLLAGAGVYAVMSYLVAGRRHEMAVRLALGATPRQLAALITRDGFRLAVPGVIVGAVLAAIAAQIARREIFGISPFDPVSFGGVAMILLIVALAATLLPALRASKLDPLVTLRRQ